jgi:hypothetical protein
MNECKYCGAPIADIEDKQCRYCGLPYESKSHLVFEDEFGEILKDMECKITSVSMTQESIDIITMDGRTEHRPGKRSISGTFVAYK